MSTALAERRATALRLCRDGLSLRAIADQLGTSKDTVSRDIKAAERDEARQAHATPPQPAPPSRDSGETPVAPRLELELDDQLCRDLATIACTGLTPRDAVRLAVAFVAHGYRWAWDEGLYPEGVAPPRMSLRVPTYDGRATALSRRATDGPEAG
ncbi:helix-turn-helix domain-containing protein [Streptomyces sp. NPDC054841]